MLYIITYIYVIIYNYNRLHMLCIIYLQYTNIVHLLKLGLLGACSLLWNFTVFLKNVRKFGYSNYIEQSLLETSHRVWIQILFW